MLYNKISLYFFILRKAFEILKFKNGVPYDLQNFKNQVLKNKIIAKLKIKVYIISKCFEVHIYIFYGEICQGILILSQKF